MRTNGLELTGVVGPSTSGGIFLFISVNVSDFQSSEQYFEVSKMEGNIFCVLERSNPCVHSTKFDLNRFRRLARYQ